MSGIVINNLIRKTADIFRCAGIGSPETDAFELMNYVTGLDRKDLLSDPDAAISEVDAVRFHALAADRVRRIPLQHITGRAFFYGLEFKVNGNVLVPRFDTEILVEEALNVITPESRVLDICTGSGCIIIALDLAGNDNAKVFYSSCEDPENPGEPYGDTAYRFNFKEGVAADVSGAALKVAKENAEKHGAANVTFVQGDLFDGITGAFDVIVSNPPYIATGEIESLEPEVSRFDPYIALDGGEDGLVFYRRIIKRAPCFLNEGGHIFLETGYDQGRAVSDLLKEEGFKDVAVIRDYGGNDRVVRGKKQ